MLKNFQKRCNETWSHLFAWKTTVKYDIQINVESWTSVANNMQHRYDYMTITHLKIKRSSTLDYIIYFIFKRILIHIMYLKKPLRNLYEYMSKTYLICVSFCEKQPHLL